MSSHKKFRKSMLTTSISLLLGTAVAIPSYAQEQETDKEKEDDSQVIRIVGYRSSIQESMGIKREAQGVIDAISAEDIGKFPDTNLAESLQRITGVSINRADGEGSKVTVRGFGEDFNMVTLNGRVMPAADAPASGTANSRAFNFANLASESIRSVEVYKTGRANVATGGIGATINIKTARPLDNVGSPGLNMSIGAKAVHDTTNRTGDDLTPELSGIFSYTDENQVYGISISASHQQRDSGSTGAYVNQWNTREWVNPGEPGAMAVNPNGITNAPAVGQLYAVPSDIRYTIADRERTRNNAQLVFQYRPNDNVTTTLDYTYAENELHENRGEQSIWFIQNADAVTFDTNEVVATPVILSEDINGAKDIGLAVQQRGQVNELKSFGFNLGWEVNDSFTLTLDAHDSESSSEPDTSYGGSWINVGMGANVVAHQIADYRGDLPIIIIDEIDDSGTGLNNNGQLDISDVGTQVQQISLSIQDAEVSQFRVDGEFLFDDGRFDFGIESRTQESRTKFSQTTDILGDWGISQPGDIPDDLLSPRNFPAEFDDYNTNGAWNQAFTGNAEAIGRWASQQYGVNFAASNSFATNRKIEEEVTSVYFQVSLQGEFGNMPANVLAGVRYEDTDVTSIEDLQIPSSISWLGNNDFLVNRSTEATPFSRGATYDHLLPSLDFDIELVDDVKARFSYSKTIARATFNNLSSAITVGQPSRPTTPGLVSATATAGNPALVPLESDNFDLSLEWYFDETSYVSLGFYEKRVNNFIGTVPLEQSHFDLRDPTIGPRAEAARAAIEARADHDGVVDETELFTMVVAIENGLDYDTLDPNDAEINYDVQPNSDDPLYVFTTNTPVNNEEAKIHGFELAAQHFFGDSGFGVQANYTIVRGDVGFDNNGPVDVAQFALVGLSDTANLVVMYENHGIQARIAYNWRDDFLDNTNFFNNNPSYTEAYSQVDMIVGYEINEQLSVFFEGINLTEENTRRHGRSSRQLWNLEDLGARYQLGARYTF